MRLIADADHKVKGSTSAIVACTDVGIVLQEDLCQIV